MGSDLSCRHESDWTIFELELLHTTAIRERLPVLPAVEEPSLDPVGDGEMLVPLE